MAQADGVVANGTGSAVRSDINNQYAALWSNHSGSTEPSSGKVSYQFWADTNTNILKIRNSANNAWISLFTLAGGIDVDAASNFNEDVTFTGGSYNLVWDKSDNALEFADNAKCTFGDSDLQIFHDGSNSYIKDAGTGDLYFHGDNYINFANAAGTENKAKFITNGSVDLYYDATKVFYTSSYGIAIARTTGTLNGAALAIGTGEGSNVPSGTGVRLAPTANTITFVDSSSNESDTGNIKFHNSVYNNTSSQLTFYHPSGNTGGIKFYTHSGSALNEVVNFTNTGKYNFGHSDNNAGSNGRFYVMSLTGQSTADLHVSVNEDVKALNIIHGGVATSGNPTRTMVEFRNFANGEVSSIDCNSTTVTYGTGSDYRMKENEVDISDGITRVKQLKPYRFNWKSEYGGGDKVDGFFAHEAATVVPEAVQGTKDAVDSNGDIIRQQIDPSKLVPLLTAAIQEAITKIETLETKVAALEA